MAKVKIRVREKEHFQHSIRNLYQDTVDIIRAMCVIPEKKLTPEEQVQAIYDGSARMLPHDEALRHLSKHITYRDGVEIRALYNFPTETVEKADHDTLQPAMKQLSDAKYKVDDIIWGATDVEQLGPAKREFQMTTRDVIIAVSEEVAWEGAIPDGDGARKILRPTRCY
jgi:hypothetical protein